METKQKFFQAHPIRFSLVLSVLLGAAASVAVGLTEWDIKNANDFINVLFIALFNGVFWAAFFIYPCVLTIYEGINLYLEKKGKAQKGTCFAFDMLVFCLGIIYDGIYMVIMKQVEPFADWQVQLANSARHTAVYTPSYPTVCAVVILAFIGYLALMFVPLEKMPPLAAVLSISAAYLGTIIAVLFAVQLFDVKEKTDFYLFLLPLNCILIVARIVLGKVREWETLPMEKDRIHHNAFFRFCDKILQKAKLWPVLAVIFMFPLLGILIMILLLFGQAPDAVIRAWTETSDWNLSMRQAPQNIYYDEHYLCTVAAGGHKKVVKPLRRGVRHGHEVIVNRQLCVANAFEQVLEERTPHFHRIVRNFYDTCGFPIAKKIRKKTTADLIYILMKPLEWLFLAVLYLTEVHPEDRIAVQYTNRRVQDFQI